LTARYALYFAPPRASRWGEFGARWLAQDTAAVRAPRRYGFHATLKAPFRLAVGASVARLIGELDSDCRMLSPFVFGPLVPDHLGDFVALVPPAPDPRLDAIAEHCVTRFDGLRAPLENAELAQRRRRGLDAKEEELLARWGYPYVLERYRFHMSLTGPGFSAHVPDVPNEPLLFDSICVFEEPSPGANFREMHRSPFAGIVPPA